MGALLGGDGCRDDGVGGGCDVDVNLYSYDLDLALCLCSVRGLCRGDRDTIPRTPSATSYYTIHLPLLQPSAPEPTLRSKHETYTGASHLPLKHRLPLGQHPPPQHLSSAPQHVSPGQHVAASSRQHHVSPPTSQHPPQSGQNRPRSPKQKLVPFPRHSRFRSQGVCWPEWGRKPRWAGHGSMRMRESFWGVPAVRFGVSDVGWALERTEASGSARARALGVVMICILKT